MRIFSTNTKDRQAQNTFLLLGNHPIELSKVYDVLSELGYAADEVQISFEVKDAIKKIGRQQPAWVILDDSLDHKAVNAFFTYLKNKSTRHITKTLLLRSAKLMTSYDQRFNATLWKESLSAQALANSLKKAVDVAEEVLA